MSGIGRRNGWTLGIVSVALFMVVLANLVVSVALPTIHRDLGASLQALEWTVNAYVAAYAVPLDGRTRRAGGGRGDGHAAHADAARRGLPEATAGNGDRRGAGGQRHCRS